MCVNISYNVIQSSEKEARRNRQLHVILLYNVIILVGMMVIYKKITEVILIKILFVAVLIRILVLKVCIFSSPLFKILY